MNAMQLPPLTLPAFSQLLEPAGLAPALDYARTGQLVYTELPSIDYRAKVRFVISDDITFRAGTPEEVARLIRHWRAELSPQISEEDDSFAVLGQDEDFADMDSEAPIIRLVNHLFARALDLNASDIHFEPNEIVLVRLEV
ncbi:MAG: type II/IV secretion system protein, partial [Pseudomonadota bacterium]|nr:type II/IV secretion system protein [Pseudomonadota bacterium]